MSKHNIGFEEEPQKSEELAASLSAEGDEPETLCGSLWLIELLMDIFGGGTLNPPESAQENPAPKPPRI